MADDYCMMLVQWARRPRCQLAGAIKASELLGNSQRAVISRQELEKTGLPSILKDSRRLCTSLLKSDVRISVD